MALAMRLWLSLAYTLKPALAICSAGSLLSSNKITDANMKAKFAPGQTLTAADVCMFTHTEVNFDWPEEGKVFRIMTTSAFGDAASLGFAFQYYLSLGCAYTSLAQPGSNIERCGESEPAKQHLFSFPEEMNGYRLAPLPMKANASEIREAHYNCIAGWATGCKGPLSQYVEWASKYKYFDSSYDTPSLYSSITFEHGPKVSWDNGKYGGWEAISYRTYILLFVDGKDCDQSSMLGSKTCADVADTVWLVPIFVDVDPVRGGFYSAEEFWMKAQHPRPEAASITAQAWVIPEFYSAIDGTTGSTLRDKTSGWVVRTMTGDGISPLYTNWPVCLVTSFCTRSSMIGSPSSMKLADRCGPTSLESTSCPVVRAIPPSDPPAMWSSVELLPACFCSDHPKAAGICASVETCSNSWHHLVCKPIKCGSPCGYSIIGSGLTCSEWSAQPCDACIMVQTLPNIAGTSDCGKTITVGTAAWDTCNPRPLTTPTTTTTITTTTTAAMPTTISTAKSTTNSIAPPTAMPTGTPPSPGIASGLLGIVPSPLILLLAVGAIS